MGYAHCDRCDTEIEHEGATHDCVQVLRLRIEALEKAFKGHWHNDGLHETGLPWLPGKKEV